MKLHIIAVSQKQDSWVEEASNEYIKRFGVDYALVLKMIKPAKRKEGRKIASLLGEEEQKIKAALPHRAHPVVMDETGRAMNSIAFAKLLQYWEQQSLSPCFIIGSADGVSENLKKQSTLLQLSEFTLPHGLAKVILIEQLYRAVSIIKGLPYHRD
jgi:ribosomal RNA large subunit methyltransferase H